MSNPHSQHPDDPTHVGSSTNPASSSTPSSAAPSQFAGFRSSFFSGDSSSAAPNSRPSNTSGASTLFSGSYAQSSPNPNSSNPSSSSSTHSPTPSDQTQNLRYNANRRTSVSAESLNPAAFYGASIETPTSNLTPDQLARLNRSVAKNFLFNNLDEDALHRVLGSLQEKTVPAGHVIIKQGDEGDYFYVVERGEVEYSVDGKAVGKAGSGASFGELALMYNAPRAATVTATTESVLWALDRMTFRRILLDKTAIKRRMYEDFLKEVPILRSLDTYQLSKLADALSTESFEAGKQIIKQGDIGDKFYIVESGEAVVTKKDGEEDKEEKVVQELKKGSYFGEVALLNDLPRQATVTAKTKVSVVCLDKAGFQRLLGPVVDVLKAHDPTQH